MNTSELIFGKYGFLTESPAIAIPCILVLIIASVIGTFDNVVVLLVLFFHLDFSVVNGIFMANLAMSDLFVTVVVDPLSIVAKLEGEDFFNKIPHFCRIVGCLCTISCVNSLGTIACMSFNRCIHICFHKYYHRIFTKKSCIAMCISLYGVGTALVLLNAVGVGDHEFDRKSLQCIWDRMASYPYTVVFSVTLVWIPIVVTGICYMAIFITVSNSQKRVQNHNLDQGQAACRSVKPPFQRSVRLAKTLFIIYAVFSVCWIPYALIIVIDTHDTYSHVSHVYITMWAHLHPSVNWLVYYLTNKKFSDAIDKLPVIRSCFRICKREDITPVENFSNSQDTGS